MRFRSIIVLIVFLQLSNTLAFCKSQLVGTWIGVDTFDHRTDTYTFQIKEKKDGSFTGFIETKMDGAMLPRMTITKIKYNHPDFSCVIKSGDLVITYSAKMSDDYNRLVGYFEYSDPEILKKELILRRQINDEFSLSEYHYKKPTSTTFPVASIGEVKLHERIINDLLQSTTNGEFGEINSLIIIKDNKLVVEEYFNGFSSNQLHQLQSCTKSITSLLIGIAIDKGYINSVEDKVLSFYKNYDFAEGWENVTIRDLLTMSSGVQWINEDQNSLWDKDEKISSLLLHPITGNTGVDFNYNSVMQVLAGILEYSTGMKLEEFAQLNLFQPLEIKDYAWQLSKVDSIPLCTGSLKLRPIDMAKFGLLVLNNGIFHNIRVLSEKWINESTKVQIEVPNNRGHDYGYLWWVKTRSPRYIYAHGLGSQFIFIVPELELVMVTTGNNFYNNQDLSPFKMIEKYILKNN